MLASNHFGNSYLSIYLDLCLSCIHIFLYHNLVFDHARSLPCSRVLETQKLFVITIALDSVGMIFNTIACVHVSVVPDSRLYMSQLCAGKFMRLTFNSQCHLLGSENSVFLLEKVVSPISASLMF